MFICRSSLAGQNCKHCALKKRPFSVFFKVFGHNSNKNTMRGLARGLDVAPWSENHVLTRLPTKSRQSVQEQVGLDSQETRRQQ